MAIALVACLMFAGCGGSSSSVSSSSAEASSSSAATSSASSGSASSASASSGSAQAEGELVFGEKTATAIGVPFTNETGADITALSAVPSSGTGAAVALMKDGDVFPSNKKAMIYVEPGADGVYNLTFLSGGVARELHNVNFPLITEASIRTEGDVVFIGAMIGGNLVSSLQEEYDIVHPPAAEPQAVETQAADEPANEGEVYYEEVEYTDDSGNDAPAQSEDGCVTDIVLR